MSGEYPEIRFGVPIPARRPVNKWREVARKMPVGAFVEVNNILHAKAMYNAFYKSGMKGTRKAVGGGKFRVWRVA